MNLVFDLREDLLLRFAASRALSRPLFNDLSPGVSDVLFDARTASQGNPDLEPLTVNQVDLGLEYYFAEESVVSATLFYKDVESFVVSDVVDRPINFGGPLIIDGADQNGEIFQITTPVNDGEGATIKGIELTYQQPLMFLPIEGFGIRANYTYADSEVNANFNGFDYTVGLQYSPQNSFNLVGYYENDVFSVRLAYAWQDEFVRDIRNGSRPSTSHFARGQLDLSSVYAVSNNIDLTLDVFNITNEAEDRFNITSDRIANISNQGITAFGGARFRF